MMSKNMSTMEPHKYEKIRHIGHPDTDGLFDADGEIVVQEKLDGANFRFAIDDSGVLTFGSKNVSFHNVDADNIPKSFRPTIEYVTETINRENIIPNEPLTVFGESMHSHTIEYNWDNVPRFIGFDVYDHTAGSYYGPYESIAIIERLGFETPHVYEKCSVDEFDADDYEKPQSQFRNGLAEGVVVRNTVSDVKAKIITEEFAEKHGSAKSDTDGNEHTDDAWKMAEQYTGADNRRIRKQIQKLTVDEGHDLEMPLMEHLGKRVIDDIAIEEADEFIYENWEIDFHEFRSAINKLCVRTLRDEMRHRTSDEAIAN